MKTFMRYLRYRLETTTLRTLVFTVISVMLSLSVIKDCIRVYDNEYKYAETGIYILAVVLGIICTLIPILENMGFKNRRNLDTLFFFPLKREKMALVHFLSGFIQVTAIYTATFVVSAVYLAANTDFFELYHLVGYYFLSLLLGFVMYSFFIFVFEQGNTVADGVVFAIMWSLAFWVVWEAAYSVWLSSLMAQEDWHNAVYSYRIYSDWGIAYGPINNLTVIFQDLIEVNKHGWYQSEYPAKYMSQWYMFVAWVAVGAAAAIGYFVTFTKKGAHKAGEVSDSWFGYRLLIPIYGYSLHLLTGIEGLLTILIFAAMIIGYIIYRRSFKLKTSDLIVTACGIIPMIIGAM